MQDQLRTREERNSHFRHLLVGYEGGFEQKSGAWCWERCIMPRTLGVGVKSHKLDGMRSCDGLNKFPQLLRDHDIAI